jgi:peptidoglycan/LPS O-acetylase OafA/YrhL
MVTATLGTATPAPPRSGFRPDIQGLRAVAVLAVLGFHAGIPQLGGGFAGVDVFFVISGYLITGLILREIVRTGRLDLAAFWARRARRLLPATAVVLVATAGLTWAFLPTTRWSSIAWDTVASALYAMNWRLADGATDYLASENAASPLQHFWSLAVEEQFYLVWPLLIMALLLVFGSGARRRMLFAGVALLSVPSLAWSVYLTEASSGPAYFVTTTRVWELGIGAMLALIAPSRLRRLHRHAGVLGWAGLAAIAAAVLFFSKDTIFPGYAALLPTLGAALCLAAGEAGPNSASRLLGIAPMTAVGTLSYSLYLWHWPLLVVATAQWGTAGKLPVSLGVAVVVASVLPAWLTYRLVEDPLHHARRFAGPGPAALLGVVCTVLALLAAVAVVAALPARAPAGVAAPGAAVLGDRPAADPAAPVDSVDYLTPDVLSAGKDLGGLGGKPCIDSNATICEYGPATATTTVAIVGDSKMHQWLPALQAVADLRKWRLLTMLRSNCPLTREPTLDHRDGSAFEECAATNEVRYRALLTREDIDVVIVSQRSPRVLLPGRGVAEQQAAMVKDLRRTWADLRAARRKVVVLLDNPSPPSDVMDCVALHHDELSECAFARAEGDAMSAAPVQREALRGARGVGVVDVGDWICPGTVCPAVIGNVLVYRQGSHLTATYVRTLTPRIDAALRSALRS